MSWFWHVLAGAVLVLAATPARGQEPLIACQPDERLSHAAAELVLRGDDTPQPQQLTAAVRAAGSETVSLHALFVAAGAGPAPLRSWLAERRERSDAELVCGSASSERGQLVISSAKAGELAPIDPDKRVVRGSLVAGFTKAELVIASVDGDLVRVGVSPDALHEGVHLEESLRAPLKVQLVATGPAGPRPIAERIVDPTRDAAADESASAWREAGEGSTGSSSRSEAPSASVELPTRSGGSPGAEGTAAKAADGSSERERAAGPATELAKLVLGLRRAERLGSLRDNRLLREAASKHARDVCKQGRIAHQLAQGQDPPARLAAAGLAAQLVGEAIARARDADDAFDALQRSPSHRLTMLDRRFTDLGVGGASDDAGKICFVVLLAQWPRYVAH